MATTQSLPKWAQTYIKQLERDVEYWQKLAHVDSGTPTRIQVRDRTSRKPEQLNYLPEDSIVRYFVGKGRSDSWRNRDGVWVDVMLETRIGNLNLQASDGLAIYGNSSNTMKVGVVDRWNHTPLAEPEGEIF